MFTFCGYCGTKLEEGVCTECNLIFVTTKELAGQILEVALDRQDACNAFLEAATKALEKCNPGEAEGIITATTEFITEVASTDQTLFDLLDYIDEPVCICEESECTCEHECCCGKKEEDNNGS